MKSKQRKTYSSSLDSSVGWIHRSIRAGGRGSSAYFGLWGTWSRSYPETTGYIIPTLLEYAEENESNHSAEVAIDLGNWLLDIQHEEGYWYGGFHPPDRPEPSVFNTAQILLGLVALYKRSGKPAWISAAERGARWLADAVTEEGVWLEGNYKNGYNPAYYSRVAWPLLAVWSETQVGHFRTAAERVLDRVVSLRSEEGGFEKWGFEEKGPAYTHTIAYTLRGLIESARIVGKWSPWGAATEKALEHLYRQAELRGGRLPGAYTTNWEPVDYYTCPTGNAQLALCFLKYFEREGDLRLLNASCKLVDSVCTAQSQNPFLGGLKGAMPGSRPLWGRYMIFRYPNWAAKFASDALIELMKKVDEAEANLYE